MNCFRSKTFFHFFAVLVVLLSALAPCNAQKLKGIEQEPASDSQDQASVHKMLHLGSGKVRPMRQAVGTSAHSEPQA